MTSPTTLELRARSVGPWPMNTYALVCPETRESVLIDPGAELESLEALLVDSKPVAILLTHTHPDHVGALAEMRTLLGVPLLAHAGPHFQNKPLDADRTLAHGDTVTVGTHTLRVYHTPGHLDDMLSFAVEGGHDIVVGDTLFAGGPGRTSSPEAFQITLHTLQTIVLAWPDDTTLHPGHGPAFRLGDLRSGIEQFIGRDHGQFFGDATW